MAEHLEAITAGELRFVIINMPPRNMKTLTCTVMWPVWEWGPRNLPHLRYLFSSYGAELSTKQSIDRRTLIESEWYSNNWGDRYELTSDNNRKTEFVNNHRGVMAATSTGGPATGKGGQRIIIDDPLNPKKADSKPTRDAANTHFDRTLYSRLDNKRLDAILIVMQRLHENDPTGHILKDKSDLGFYHLKLPSIAPTRQIVIFPMSKRTVIREPGDLLWPEKEPADVLADAKLALGSYGFAGQYQQEPAPDEGGVIKRAWFKRYPLEQQPSSFDRIVISADCAFKDFTTSSKVALHVWGAIGPRRYLLARDTRHMGMTETVSAIKALKKTWDNTEPRVQAILVEDKANGPAVIEELSKTIPGVIPYEPRGSKPARILAVSPQMEAGNIYLAQEPWCDEVIDALCFVPNGENWDDVDATSQALDYLGRTPENFADSVVTVGAMASAQADW